VQHENDALGWRQRLEDDKQRELDRLGQKHFLLGITSRLGRGPLRSVGMEALFTPRFARAQHVETHPRHHRGQPTGEVVEAGGIDAAQPQPGFLYGVVGLAPRAEHAIGHASQMCAVVFEAPRQNTLFVHESPLLLRLRHSYDERGAADVTADRFIRQFKG